MNNIRESDLFIPVKELLEKEGFQVKGEVKSCDVVGVKDNEIVIVELKTNFNLKLVYQAMDRQSLTDNVYVAIPRPKTGHNSKSWKSMVKLLKTLNLGLITVALDGCANNADFIINPQKPLLRKNYSKKKKLDFFVKNS